MFFCKEKKLKIKKKLVKILNFKILKYIFIKLFYNEILILILNII